MGGEDKGLVVYNDRLMIQFVVDALSPALDRIIINANRNISRYQSLGYPVVPDETVDYAGPLAGILSGLQAIETAYAFVVPCDAPQLNIEILHRLYAAIDGYRFDVAVASVGQQLEPVFMLVRKSRDENLRAYLNAGLRKTSGWIQEQNSVAVDFSDHPEWFGNINSLADLQAGVKE